ncbi:MAG: DUF58 domain-containing protein [Sulfobacillus sp.]
MSAKLQPWLVALAVVLTILLSRLFPGTVWGDLLRVAAMACALTACCHLFQPAGQLRLRVDPALPAAGRPFRMTAHLRAVVPGYYQVTVQAPTETVVAGGWAWSHQAAFAMPLSELRRGEHTFYLSDRYRDPFGLLERQLVRQERVALRVRPATVDVDPLRVFGPLAVLGSSVSAADDDPAGARAWQPGDRLSRVHWPQTARLGEVQVREAWHRTSLPCLVGLDTRRSSYASADGFEVAVSLAASVTFAMVRRRLAVSLFVGGRQVGVQELQEQLLWDLFIRLRPDGGGSPLPELRVGSLPLLISGSRISDPSGHFRLWCTEPGGPASGAEILSLADLLDQGRRQRWAQ